jgi:hypothetical protein
MMSSQAQVEAARRNARKSTGPKTEEGKQRSRMNALKHGLTARLGLLPAENPDIFKRHMLGFFQAHMPQDDAEASLVERLAYTMWKISRVERTQCAWVCEKINRERIEEALRTERETCQLERALFRPPFGRTAALPAGAAGAQNDNPEGDGRPDLKPNIVDHPRDIVCRMQESALGCASLLVLWSELRTRLRKDGWKAPERFRFFRLLGIHPKNVYMNSDLAITLQACQALDSDVDARSLVSEVWNEGVPADKLPELEALYEREIADVPAIDLTQARGYLIGRIEEETSFIELKLNRHEELAETRDALSAHELALGRSSEGILLRRYEQSCTRDLFRYEASLQRHREAKANRTEDWRDGPSYRLTPAWEQECKAIGESESQTDGAQPAEGEGRPSPDPVAVGEREASCHGAEEPEEGVQTDGAEGCSDADVAEATASSDAFGEASVNVAETGPRIQTQRTREVGDGACVIPGQAGAAATTNGLRLSHTERKRRRREERKRAREMLVVSG